VLSDAVLYGVRTFLGPDNAGPRSPNRPEAALSYTQGDRASTVLEKIKTIFLNCNRPSEYEPQACYTPWDEWPAVFKPPAGTWLLRNAFEQLLQNRKIHWSFLQKTLKYKKRVRNQIGWSFSEQLAREVHNWSDWQYRNR